VGSVRDLSDSGLVDKLRAGHDAAAIAEAIRRYGGMVYATACRRQGDAAEQCRAVFTHLANRPYDVSGALPLWLYASITTKADAREAGAEPLLAHLDSSLASLAPRDRGLVLALLAAEAPNEIPEPCAQFMQTLATAGVVIGSDTEAFVQTFRQQARQELPAELTNTLARLTLAALPGENRGTGVPALDRARLYSRIGIVLLIIVVVGGAVVYGFSRFAAAKHTQSEAR
jgi:hypothetical protein